MTKGPPNSGPFLLPQITIISLDEVRLPSDLLVFSALRRRHLELPAETKSSLHMKTIKNKGFFNILPSEVNNKPVPPSSGLIWVIPGQLRPAPPRRPHRTSRSHWQDAINEASGLQNPRQPSAVPDHPQTRATAQLRPIIHPRPKGTRFFSHQQSHLHETRSPTVRRIQTSLDDLIERLPGPVISFAVPTISENATTHSRNRSPKESSNCISINVLHMPLNLRCFLGVIEEYFQTCLPAISGVPGVP